MTSETVQRGANVFEGLRAYPDGQGEMFIVRLNRHLTRLRQSAKVMRLPIAYSDAELETACADLVRANEFRDREHLRMTAYFDTGRAYAWLPEEMTAGLSIFGSQHSANPSIDKGIRSCISTWRRNSDEASPSRIKAAANYHNSRLAQVEARLRGVDIPLMLNARGKVAESPSSCFFMVREGVLITPPVTDDILESITREAIMTLSRAELGMEVVERSIDRTEVYICDEAFFCASGHEIMPIIAIDDYEIGDGAVGPQTRAIQGTYFDVVAGRMPAYQTWLTPVYAGRGA